MKNRSASTRSVLLLIRDIRVIRGSTFYHALQSAQVMRSARDGTDIVHRNTRSQLRFNLVNPVNPVNLV